MSSLVERPQQVHSLNKECELRLEVDASGILIRLVSGNAEIFGTELALEKAYKIHSRKFAVFTWTGAEIMVEGTPVVAYVSTETPMMQYLNVHDYLENLRSVAEKHQDKGDIVKENSDSKAAMAPPGLMTQFGPRVMVVGGTDSGKSSLSQLLCNYAVRAGRTPTLVDLDVGQNGIAIPGCVSALPVHHPADVETGSFTATKLAHAPLTYFFGHVSPSPNEDLYKRSCEVLSKTLYKKMEAISDSRIGGCIVNTCGWVDGAGYAMLLHLISTFRINVILVLGHERLYNDLKREYYIQQSGSELIKLAKSEGVVVRDADYRRTSRADAIHQYFYGSHNDLAPHPRQINVTDFHFVKILSSIKTPASLLPIGAKPTLEGFRVTKVTIAGPPADARKKEEDPLLHSVVAVMHCNPSLINNADALLQSNVAGFLNIQSIDALNGRVTVLGPCPGPFPSKVFLTGTIKWSDY